MKATEKIKIYTFMQTKVMIEIANKQGYPINKIQELLPQNWKQMPNSIME